MNFLQPGWLWGLLALTIPIIIHLFNFRKTRRIYFSNTKFIKKVQEASKSRRKLKHYLVLMSRLLFLFWLIMAFAQPFIPAKEGVLQQERVYIYLDNSYSMGNFSGTQITALEEGIEYIEALVNIYPAGTDFYLLTNDFAPFSHSPRSGEQMLELLTEIKLTGVVRNMEEITGRWHNQQVMEGEGDNYYISDFQKSTLEPHLIEQQDQLELKLLPVKVENTNNVFIDTVYLDNPFLIGKERVRLFVKLTNAGTEDLKDIPVTVHIDNNQAASTSAEINSGGSKILNFDLMVNNISGHQGRVSIEEYPVTFDNDIFFVLDLGNKINIIEVKPENERTPVESVYGNEDLFSFSSFNVGNLDYNIIGRADLMVLNGLDVINPSLNGAIASFMRKGGNVLVIPGENPELLSYSSLFGDLSEADSTGSMALRAPDFNDPFFAQVFEEDDTRVNMPEAIPAIAWSGGANILSLSNGNPFFSKRGEKVYLLASPLKEKFTNFYQHALFVPVMYKIAALSANNYKPLYYYLDDHLIPISLDSTTADKVYKLYSAEGEIIPAQRIIGNTLLLEIPGQSLNKGYYNLVIEDVELETIAFNINKQESNLESLSSEELEELTEYFPNTYIYDIDDSDQLKSTLKAQYSGISLWKYCLVLSIIFLIAEILIIRYIK